MTCSYGGLDQDGSAATSPGGTSTGRNGGEATCLPLVSAGWERVQLRLTPPHAAGTLERSPELRLSRLSIDFGMVYFSFGRVMCGQESMLLR